MKAEIIPNEPGQVMLPRDGFKRTILVPIIYF